MTQLHVVLGIVVLAVAQVGCVDAGRRTAEGAGGDSVGGSGAEAGSSEGGSSSGGSHAGGSHAGGAGAGGSHAGGTSAGGKGTGGSAGTGSGGAIAGSGGARTGGTGAGGGGGVAPAGKIPVFVAQGQMGRTTISCDGGKTWVGNRSWDTEGDAMMCGVKQNVTCGGGVCSYRQPDGTCYPITCCNGGADVARGVTFGNGQFVATWGWGVSVVGSVRRSANGLAWTNTHTTAATAEETYGGLAFGLGNFVVVGATPLIADDGAAWSRALLNEDGTTIRSVGYGDYAGGGRFVAVAHIGLAGGPPRDIFVSSDGGTIWWKPKTIPAACAPNMDTGAHGGVVAGNGIFVIVDQAANACRSTDGGVTWSVVPTGVTEILSHGVWTGSEFRFWGNDNGAGKFMVSSADGVTWKKTPMLTDTNIGPVALGASGTLVALRSSDEGYAQQQFLRSTDGLTWEKLPATAFVGSHRLSYIAFGYADPSAACPAQ